MFANITVAPLDGKRLNGIFFMANIAEYTKRPINNGTIR